MMQTSTIAAMSGIPALVISYFATYGVIDTAIELNAPVERHMVLQNLEFKDGIIIQQHMVTGGVINANWSAEIVRNKRQLCSGGGYAPYEGGLKHFTPDEWTGDNCPPLKSGDVLRAAWEYKNTEGLIVSLSGSITVKDTQ